jgi:hypothetical protein
MLLMSIAPLTMASGPSGAQQKGAEAFLTAVASGNPQAVAQEMNPDELANLRSRLLTLLHAAIAFTPLFDWLAVTVIGVPEAVREPARLGLRIMLPWTLSIAYRRTQQGVLIRFGHARAVTWGTAVRLGTNALVLALGAWWGRLPGIVVGTSAVAHDQAAPSAVDDGATMSSACGASVCPSTRRHRLVPLKKPRSASSQAVRTELSYAQTW